MSYEFKSYSPEEFEKLIINNPLNEVGVETILKNYINKIEFRDMQIRGRNSLCGIILYIEKADKFNIYISTNFDEEEQKKTVVHEILQIKYNASGATITEGLLEKETERIYRENPQLADYIFREFKTFQAK